jgi:hypothetical protein
MSKTSIVEEGIYSILFVLSIVEGQMHSKAGGTTERQAGRQIDVKKARCTNIHTDILVHTVRQLFRQAGRQARWQDGRTAGRKAGHQKGRQEDG